MGVLKLLRYQIVLNEFFHLLTLGSNYEIMKLKHEITKSWKKSKHFEFFSLYNCHIVLAFLILDP